MRWVVCLIVTCWMSLPAQEQQEPAQASQLRWVDGFETWVTLSSAHADRGYNHLQNRSQWDQTPLVTPGMEIRFPGNLLLGTLARIQFAGGNVRQKVRDTLGLEQIVYGTHELEFVHGGMESGLTAYFYPWSQRAAENQGVPLYLEPRLNLYLSLGSNRIRFDPGMEVNYLFRYPTRLRSPGDYLYSQVYAGVDFILSEGVKLYQSFSGGYKWFPRDVPDPRNNIWNVAYAHGISAAPISQLEGTVELTVGWTDLAFLGNGNPSNAYTDGFFGKAELTLAYSLP